MMDDGSTTTEDRAVISREAKEKSISEKKILPIDSLMIARQFCRADRKVRTVRSRALDLYFRAIT